MSRTLTTAMRNETIAAEVRPAYFVRMIFDNSVLNIWTGIGNIAFGGNTYTGTGDLLNISEITESAELTATGINVTLTGIKSSFLVIAKDEQYQGRELIVSFGAFTTAGALIADPAIVFSGFMDTMTITEAGEYSTITVAVENKLIAFERSKVRRYTAEDQKIDYPLKLPNGNDNPNYDAGFEFVTSIVEREIIWGRPTSGSSPGGPGAGDNQGNQQQD